MAKLPAELAEPSYSTALGLIYYGNRSRYARRQEEGSFGSKIKSFFNRAAM